MSTHLLRAIFSDISTKTSVFILFCTPDEINEYSDETISYSWYTDLNDSQKEGSCITCLFEREITLVDRERQQKLINSTFIDGFVTRGEDIPHIQLVTVSV